MKCIFNLIAIALLTTGLAQQAYAQESAPFDQVTINGEELDQLLNDIAETIEENTDDKSISINIGTQDSQRFRGSGRIITEKRTVPADYRGIITSRAIKVTLDDRTGSTAIIRADDNVMPHIKIEDRNGVLEIKIDDSIKTINNVTAEVSLPRSTGNLSHLEASSAASINVDYAFRSSSLEVEATSAANIFISKADTQECEIEVSSAASVSGTLKATDCEIDATSAAKATLQLLANECEADASSAAKITLSGEVGKLSTEASSAANINAADVKVLLSGEADASSGADIKIQAGRSLSADASSGGTVHYKSDNDLNIHINKSSGGSVRKM